MYSQSAHTVPAPTKDVKDMTTEELTPEMDLTSLMIADLRIHLANLTLTDDPMQMSGSSPTPDAVVEHFTSKEDVVDRCRHLLLERDRRRNPPPFAAVVPSSDPAPPPRVTSRLPSADQSSELPTYNVVTGQTNGAFTPPSMTTPVSTPTPPARELHAMPSYVSSAPTSPAQPTSSQPTLTSMSLPLPIAPTPSPLPPTQQQSPVPAYRKSSNTVVASDTPSTNPDDAPPIPSADKGKAPSDGREPPPMLANTSAASLTSTTGTGEMVVSSTAPEIIKRFLYPAENGDTYSQIQLARAYQEGKAGVGVDMHEAYEWYMRAATLGLAEAQVQVGVMLQDGLLGQGIGEGNLERAADMYARAAGQGDTEGMTKLGRCYMNGWGVPRNEILAASWYRLAARQGSPRAQNQLGWCYWKGKGVEKNWDEAVKWYRISADNGHPEGQTNMGLAYLYGWGGVKDPVEAVQWFWRAAENGVATAALELGVCCEKGIGVQKDPEKAALWYRRSADLGYDKAIEKLGSCYLHGIGVAKDPVEAVRWFRVAAEKNYYPAIGRLGIAYKEGNGVEQDYGRACQYFEAAAALGCSTSKTNLANCYENGFGVPMDLRKAIALYTEAANVGNSQAQSNLGFCFERGLGVPQNLREADRLYKLAAAKEHPQAMSSLASFYELGLADNPKDPVMASRLYAAAARKGDASGMFKLGRCYELGIGTSRDAPMAYKWYKRAAAQKHSFAQTNLGNMLLNGIGIPANPQEGLRLLTAASEEGGNVVAMQLLSRCYESGVYGYATTGGGGGQKVIVLEPDAAKAKMWYDRAMAAARGQEQIELAVASAAKRGEAVPEDLHKGVKRMNVK